MIANKLNLIFKHSITCLLTKSLPFHVQFLIPQVTNFLKKFVKFYALSFSKINVAPNIVKSSNSTFPTSLAFCSLADEIVKMILIKKYTFILTISLRLYMD